MYLIAPAGKLLLARAVAAQKIITVTAMMVANKPVMIFAE
jgi:hypothetical protein